MIECFEKVASCFLELVLPNLRNFIIYLLFRQNYQHLKYTYDLQKGSLKQCIYSMENDICVTDHRNKHYRLTFLLGRGYFAVDGILPFEATLHLCAFK